MAVEQMIARIDENVKYLIKARQEDKASFDQHVSDDKKIVNDFIRPLWEKSQQDIGAARQRSAGGTWAGFLINAGIAIAAAWAAVKGLGK